MSLDLSLVLIMLVILCETALLVYLYFISRFYELKFRQRTFHPVFLVAAALLVGCLAIALLGYYSYEAVMLANVLALGVFAVFGLRLFRMMTGVTK